MVFCNTKKEMDAHYANLNKKLDRLIEAQRGRATHTTQEHQRQFNPRTVNMTRIRFTKEEMDLLDMGLHYSLQIPSTASWTNLAMETEQAIRQLDIGIQDTYRNLAATKLRQLLNTNPHNSAHKRQAYVLKNIKQKLAKGKATVTRADKGRTTVIIHSQHYNNKVHSFLSDNLHIVPQDPTKKYQTKILKTLQQSNQIIDKKQIKFLTQKNPLPSLERFTKASQT
jgi:uncharacterized protein YukE